MDNLLNGLTTWGEGTMGGAWPVVWNLVKIVLLVLPLLGAVAYLTLWERKLIGFMHLRLGPNRVGPGGLLQPIADAFKLIFKKSSCRAGQPRPVHPRAGDDDHAGDGGVGGHSVRSGARAGQRQRRTAAAAGDHVGRGLRSHHRRLGVELEVRVPRRDARPRRRCSPTNWASASRSSSLLMVSGSMNFSDIVLGQDRGWFADRGINFLSWNWLPLLPIFVVYVVSSVAETNRHPFDVVEGESEIVAGHMVEYSGMGFAIFFLAEYANMILLSAVASVMFLGGWLRRSIRRSSTGFRAGYGSGSRLSSSFRCTSGSVRPSAAIATTRSCVSAGRSSFRHVVLAGRHCRLDADALEHLELTGAQEFTPMAAVKDFLSSFMLREMLDGMRITGKYLFARKITIQYPEEKTPKSPALPRPARTAPLSERRRALHRVQLCEAVCPALAITVESAERDDGTRRTTRYDIDLIKCIFCGFCEESCPVDSIVETNLLEYHGEKRGDLYFTKEMLLAVGDRYEQEIAADRAADARYR